jgi:hypothetical protein
MAFRCGGFLGFLFGLPVPIPARAAAQREGRDADHDECPHGEQADGRWTQRHTRRRTATRDG